MFDLRHHFRAVLRRIPEAQRGDAVAVYGRLNDDDLKAIFAHLRTQKPVRHRVDNSEPPTYCKFCGKTHGGGALNP